MKILSAASLVFFLSGFAFAGASEQKFITTSNPILGRYIIVLKGSWTASFHAEGLIQSKGGSVIKRFNPRTLNGYLAEISEEGAIALSRDEQVDFVEQDSIMKAVQTDSNVPWGVDRIDQENLPLSETYTYTNTGAGVSVYILDTGIRPTHQEFAGRAFAAYDVIDDGRNGIDCNGHGTHVAGTIGGTTYGVAKKVDLYGVRVLNCSGSGTTSGIIQGIEWVNSNRKGPSVVNMSLGGSISEALDLAVRNSISEGVIYSLAAGNESTTACNGSPARVKEAITVGASTKVDQMASFSNYGSCVDLFAPGSSITSAWITSDSATNTISGTSMASPHVAGVVALYLQSNPSATPAQVAQTLTSYAFQNRLTGLGTGSPNLLLSALILGEVQPNPEPTITPTPTPSPIPSVTPTPSLPCSDCAVYKGAFTRVGEAQFQPNSIPYYARSGIHRAYLTGPSGVDLGLALFQWNDGDWTTVLSNLGSGSNKQATYQGRRGYYLWGIKAIRGIGNYQIGIKYRR